MRAPRCRLVPLVALLLTLALPAGASPITVTAADVVTVTFGTVPGNWDPTDPPDYLELYLGGWSSFVGDVHPDVTVALYDGNRLLGQQTNLGSMFGLFYGAGLEVRRGETNYTAPRIADFTSLLDGTIDGRLELSFASGAFVFDPASFDLRSFSPNYIGPHPLMLFDVTPNGGWNSAAAGDFDWVRDVKIGVTQGEVLTPVPEPGTLSLLATGLGIGWLRFRKRAL
jgi:PEP-CTERM motif